MHRDLRQAQSSLKTLVKSLRNRKIKISVQLVHKLCFHATFVGFFGFETLLDYLSGGFYATSNILERKYTFLPWFF